jgi:hypothetical protein
MNISTKGSLGLLALVLASLPAFSQEVKTYGGQVTLALPTGGASSKEWLDGKLGGGAGVHMLIGFEGGHAIMPRFDYTYFKKSEGGIDRKMQSYQLGADYNYFLGRKVNEGPYVGGGLGLAATKFQLDGQGYHSDDTPVTGYAAASAGWVFTPHVGAELRYTYSRYKPDVAGFAPMGFNGKPSVDAPALNASLIFRL